jgi:hypothetical protein
MEKLERPVPFMVFRTLLSVGVQPVRGGEWHRVFDSVVREGEARWVCMCGEAVVMQAATIRRLEMFVGQCGACRAIYWQERRMLPGER